MSQKSYVWNNNNAVAYSDPTGYAGIGESNLFFDPEYSNGGSVSDYLHATETDIVQYINSSGISTFEFLTVASTVGAAVQ
jgi:hypothetical protein